MFNDEIFLKCHSIFFYNYEQVIQNFNVQVLEGFLICELKF